MRSFSINFPVCVFTRSIVASQMVYSAFCNAHRHAGPVVENHLSAQAQGDSAGRSGHKLRENEDADRGRHEEASMVPVGVPCVIFFPVSVKVSVEANSCFRDVPGNGIIPIDPS